MQAAMASWPVKGSPGSAAATTAVSSTSRAEANALAITLTNFRMKDAEIPVTELHRMSSTTSGAPLRCGGSAGRRRRRGEDSRDDGRVSEEAEDGVEDDSVHEVLLVD